jgi:hypothetical protein
LSPKDAESAWRSYAAADAQLNWLYAAASEGARQGAPQNNAAHQTGRSWHRPCESARGKGRAARGARHAPCRDRARARPVPVLAPQVTADVLLRVSRIDQVGLVNARGLR